MAVFLIGVIFLGGGGFLAYQFVYKPWDMRSKQLANLKKDANNKIARLDDIAQKRPNLTRYQMLSLPGEEEVAQREYEKYLTRLLDHHNIKTDRSVTPQKGDTSKTAPATADKVPIYKRLSFHVHALATTDNIVTMLKEFYSTGLLQEIRSLTLKRQLTTSTPGGGRTSAEELDLEMTVEALIVTGAEKRPYLLPNYSQTLMAIDLASAAFGGGTSTALCVWSTLSPGRLPTGLLADPERNYLAIGKKNIFLGRPPPQAPPTPENEKPPEWIAARYSRLNAINPGAIRTSAEIYDVATDTLHKLKETAGLNTFPFVRDGGTGYRIIVGVVVKIDDRDVIYHTELDVPEVPGERATIAKVGKSERDQLLAEGAPAAVAADGVLRVDRTFWEKLLRQKIIVKKDGHFAVEMTREREPPAQSGRRPVAAAPGGRGPGAGGRGGFGGGRGRGTNPFGGRGTGAGAPPGGAAPPAGEAGAAPGDGGEFGEFGGFGGFGPPPPFELMRIKVVFDDENQNYLYIQPEDHYYALHFGDSLEDSLKHPLSKEKVKELAAR
jgi:hypothetical protein